MLNDDVDDVALVNDDHDEQVEVDINERHQKMVIHDDEDDELAVFDAVIHVGPTDDHDEYDIV